LSKIL